MGAMMNVVPSSLRSALVLLEKNLPVTRHLKQSHVRTDIQTSLSP